MDIKIVLVLSALVLVTTGQPVPAPRCTKTPPMWKGFFYENDFTATGNEPYVRFATVDYDATVGDEKVRIIEFDELNRPGRVNSFKQEEIYLFKEKKEYIYNYDTRQCRTVDIEEEFRPFGVLNDAEFRGSFWLGVEGTRGSENKYGLDVDHFFYSQSDDDSLNHHYSSYWVQLSNIGSVCVPVEQHFINLSGPREHGPSIDARFTFLNITTVSVFPDGTFKPPAACEQ